jgi:oligopeptide/dipeptide ABC transporter ATP-binding protein
VPIPDPTARKPKDLPSGEIPSAIDPPPGCHFHPRCPYAKPECRVARPPLKDLGAGHVSACIL